MTSIYVVNVTAQPLPGGGNPLTLLQVHASTSKGLRLVRWGVSFDGTSVTNVPPRVELARQTSGSSAQASDYTPVKWDETDIDQCLATALTSFTAEPGGAGVLETHYVSPLGMPFLGQYTVDSDEQPRVAPGSRLGIRVTAPDAVNASAFLVFAE